MKAGTVVKGFRFEKQLGKGSFGQVWLCTKAGEKVAIKMMDLEEADEHVVEMEEYFTRFRCDCPFLVNYTENFRETVKERNTLFIVMEFCEQGDLSGLLEKLDIKKGIMLNAQRVMKISIQTLLALDVLHTRYIIHRDLKSLNTFINANDDVKLGDFGCCRQLNPGRMTSTPMGTFFYMAPEVLALIFPPEILAIIAPGIKVKSFDMKCDVWSFGVMMYEMMTLDFPFYEKTTPNLLKKMLSGKYTPIPKLSYPDDVIELVSKMLVVDPDKRPSTSELLGEPVVVKYAQSLGLSKYFPKSNPTIIKKPLKKTFLFRNSKMAEARDVAEWKAVMEKYGTRLSLATVPDDYAAFKVIDGIADKSSLFVATNRDTRGIGAKFLEQCRVRGVKTPALVFCHATEGWVPMANVEIQTAKGSLERFIEKIL